MSVANILGADGKISAAYLPTGTSNNYVDNPMTEPLLGGGFSMTDIDDINCSNIIAKSHDVANGAGTVIGSLVAGTPISGSVPVVLDTGLTVQGDANIGLTVGGAYGINATTASLGTLDITTGVAGSGINFTSGGSITGVVDVTASGTVQGATVNSTGDITATGTIVPSQWTTFPQVYNTTLNWAGPATEFNLYLIPDAPAGLYLASMAVQFTKNGGGGPGGDITLGYISNLQQSNVLTQSESTWEDTADGITAFTFMIVHDGGGLGLQFFSGNLSAGQSYDIDVENAGFLRLR